MISPATPVNGNPVITVAVEFILGLNGSTMGCMISFIFPALLYLIVMKDKGDKRFLAKVSHSCNDSSHRSND